MAKEIDIVPAGGPCPVNQLEAAQPTCCLKRTDTDFVLYQGDQELKRFPHRLGSNLVDRVYSPDASLLTALQTLDAMRQSGACR